MAIFGKNWCDPIDYDSPLFKKPFIKRAEKDRVEYFINSKGEYQEIKTNKELYDAIHKKNRFVFDGENYLKLEN